MSVYAALHFAITQETNFNEKMIGKVYLCLLHAACITSQSPTYSAIGNLKLKPDHSRGFISFLTLNKANLKLFTCSV